MTAPYKEGDFEKAIEAHLTDEARGAARWMSGDPSNYEPGLGIDPVELDAFVAVTQADAWEKVVTTHFGGVHAKAAASFHQAVSKMLDSQGVLRCLRSGVTFLGQDLALAYFRPE